MAPCATFRGGIARTGLTLVVYMGIARAGAIRSGLLDGGLPADTPAVAVQNASRPDERRLATTLGSLVEDLSEGRIGSPAILVIGEVCRDAAAASVSRVLAAAPRASAR